jgi:hypothetical protein
MVDCWPVQPQLQDSAEVTAANGGLRPDNFDPIRGLVVGKRFGHG